MNNLMRSIMEASNYAVLLLLTISFWIKCRIKKPMSFSREHIEQVRQPDGGKVKLPVVNGVWGQLWVILSAYLHTSVQLFGLFVCFCLWVHSGYRLCVSFGNAASQIGCQLQQWVTQSFTLDSVCCHLDLTAKHSVMCAFSFVCPHCGFVFPIWPFHWSVLHLCASAT